MLLLHRPDAAAAAAMQALARRPDDVEALLVLTCAQIALGDLEAAIATATRAVRAEHGMPVPHATLGWLLLHFGRRREAVGCCARALAIDPELAFAHDLAAHLRLQAGDPAGAVAAATRAIGLQPRDEDFRATHVQALWAAGRLDEALASVRIGLETCPEDALLHQLHGGLRLARGDVTNALTDFRTALHLEPHDRNARDGLIEAMRSRLPPYRALLRLRQRASGSLRRRGTWVLVAASIAGALAVRATTPFDPRPWLAGLPVVLLLLPVDLTNALLLLDPCVRLVMTVREKAFALLVGAAVLLAGAGALTAWSAESATVGMIALGGGIAALLASALHGALRWTTMDRPARRRIAVVAVLLLLLGVDATAV